MSLGGRAVALLVLLARAARTEFIATDLFGGANGLARTRLVAIRVNFALPGPGRRPEEFLGGGGVETRRSEGLALERLPLERLRRKRAGGNRVELRHRWLRKCLRTGAIWAVGAAHRNRLPVGTDLEGHALVVLALDDDSPIKRAP